MSETKIRDRMTVVGSVYHQPFGEEPSCVESRFSRELETTEQPCGPRRLKATEEWQPLDCGWLGGNVGMLVIKNDEGRFPQVIPTDEERRIAAAKVIELKYADALDRQCWLIYPKESVQACPADAQKLVVRCQSGVAKFTLYLLPK